MPRKTLPIQKSTKINKYQLIKWTNLLQIKERLLQKPDERMLDTHVYRQSQLEHEVECLTADLAGVIKQTLIQDECQIQLAINTSCLSVRQKNLTCTLNTT